MSHLYLTLPSNSSLQYFPENTLSNFKTKLSQRINLVGEWEVGLYEIQYPRTWNNITEKEGRFRFRLAPGGPIFYGYVKPGKYDTCHHLVHAVNDVIREKEDGEKIVLSYSTNTNRVYLFVNNGCKLWFDSALASILGFRSKNIFTGPIPFIEAEHVCDLNRGFYSLYCYCSLTSPVFVGDVQVSLLRIVPIDGKHGDMVTKTFQSIQYAPISSKDFDTIEIDIKDDIGNNVPFESGKVVVVLHLRLRRSPYLSS